MTDLASLADPIVYFAVFLLSTTLHEAAHAWVALRGGDETAYRGGQVTLNPMPHIQREPFGMVVLPILTALITGWPIGFASAPYDPQWALRHPKRAAVMALAGPAANMSLVVLSVLLLRVGAALDIFYAPQSVTFGHVIGTDAGGWWPSVALMLGAFFSVNLLLAAFNLLPLPPLDGSGALPLVLGPETARTYQQVLWNNPVLGWLGLFAAWQLFDVIFDPIFTAALNLLYPGVSYS